MASFSYQTPDLASVLATLAAHTHPPHLNPAALSSSSPFTPTPAAPQKSQDLEEGEYEPAEHISAGLDPAESFSRIPPLRSDPRIKSHTSTSHPPLSKPSPRPPTPSPAKITTWPPALRHVTKMLVPNPEFTRRVAHLIHAQHKHERQWWSGREALVQKLESREEGRRKLNDVLASVGGIIQPITSDSSPSSSSPSELVVYDRKVHRACTEMSAATSAELARLGVPFFALDPALIGGRGGGGRGETGSQEEEEQGGGEHGAKISRKEVEELKIRMLTLLRDLCGE